MQIELDLQVSLLKVVPGSRGSNELLAGCYLGMTDSPLMIQTGIKALKNNTVLNKTIFWRKQNDN